MKVFIPLNETTMASITPSDRLVPYQAGQPVLSQVKRASPAGQSSKSRTSTSPL